MHLHLLEFAHAEDELAGDDLVPEGLADLRDAERQLHAAGLLDVEEVDEDALRRLRAEIDDASVATDCAELRLEHQVEWRTSVQFLDPLTGQVVPRSSIRVFTAARSSASIAALKRALMESMSP